MDSAAAGVLVAALLLMQRRPRPGRPATHRAPAPSPALPKAGKSATEGAKSILVCALRCQRYDATAGNPAGSVAEESQVLVNALSLVTTTMTAESPDFKAVDSGAGTLSIDRQFVPGGLLEITSSSSYTATLVDKSAGTEQKAVTETVSAASPFATKQGPVALVAGDTYAIRIEADHHQHDRESRPLGANATARFDNVGGHRSRLNNGERPRTTAKTATTAAATDANGATGAQLPTHRCQSGGLTGPASSSGNAIFVKAQCPAKVGVACKITVQGMLKKGKPATTTAHREDRARARASRWCCGSSRPRRARSPRKAACCSR